MDRSIRVDLHVHTRFSPDALTSPSQLVARAHEVGLDQVAVTDHGTIEGALAAREIDPERVIVGQEIMCACRTELIGLFLEERIPTGLRVEEAVERIRAQGGLVYAPHPFAYSRRSAWHAERALAVADVVEVFNSRAFHPGWNRAGKWAAEARGLPGAASSDAHFPWEIGRAHTELASFSDASSLLEAIRHGSPVGYRTGSPLLHVGSIALHAVRGTGRLLGLAPGPPPARPALPSRRSPAADG